MGSMCSKPTGGMSHNDWILKLFNVQRKYKCHEKNVENLFQNTQAYFLRFGGDGVRDLNSKIENS